METIDENKHRIMVVKLKLSQWHPRKFDKKATRQVAEMNGIDDPREAGRFNKVLVDLDAIRPIEHELHMLRGVHYKMTAPWDDDGARVLPTDIYFPYTEMLRDRKNTITAMAERFATREYPQQRERARVRLKGLFDEKDYPPAEEIASKFGVSVKFEPLPNPEDTRVWGIGTKAAREIESEVRSGLEETMFKAQQDVVERVHTVATEFVEKVRRFNDGEQRSLRETAITNLTDTVALVLDGLNITGDQRLTDMAEQLRAAMKNLDIDMLRTGEGIRLQKSAEVEKIASRFAGVFGVAR